MVHNFVIFFSVFNVGDYRRDAVKGFTGKEFFDPDNTQAVAIRKYVYIVIWLKFIFLIINSIDAFSRCAQNALNDMCDYLQRKGEVAIFDATNTTQERRRQVYEHCTEVFCFRVFFVESICDSEEVIQANIRVSKLYMFSLISKYYFEHGSK